MSKHFIIKILIFKNSLGNITRMLVSCQSFAFVFTLPFKKPQNWYISKNNFGLDLTACLEKKTKTPEKHRKLIQELEIWVFSFDQDCSLLSRVRMQSESYNWTLSKWVLWRLLPTHWKRGSLYRRSTLWQLYLCNQSPSCCGRTTCYCKQKRTNFTISAQTPLETIP